MPDDVLTEDRDGVRYVTFNRPEARNALTMQMYQALADACASTSDNGAITALVVSGAGGKAFAAGTDMTHFRDFSTPEDAWNYETTMDDILGAVEHCEVPTIAAINGACTGGGGAIAAACDLRLATTTLKFGFPIARTLGNCLSVTNLARLADLIGAGRVREIMLTARLIGADEALAIGLVSEVVADQAALDKRVGELTRQLAGHAPLTMRASKEGLRRLRAARSVDDRDLIELCYMSADFKEGMDAFLNKRPPQWKGR